MALQGDVKEHLELLRELNIAPVPVKRQEDLKSISGLILPGGESTTLGLLLKQSGLDKAIQKNGQAGMPMWGTCMGAILLAKHLSDNPLPQHTLELMDITIKRNAFGRQRESFEQEISIPILKCENFPAVFIRAPWIEAVGPHVETLATLQGKIIFAKEKNYMASVFHPEIAGDSRIHQYFVEMIRERGFKQ